MRALVVFFALSACDGAEPVTGAEAQCVTPHAPLLPFMPAGASVTFVGDGAIETGIGADEAPIAWVASAIVVVPASDDFVVYARHVGADSDCTFGMRVRVVEAFPADVASDAIDADDAAIVGWAKSWDVAWGADNDASAQTPERALGPATGDPFDTASLGNGGVMTLGFARPIGDGDGPDFAIFENGFSDQFLELAFVEVSSDGETFVRFPTLALDMEPVTAYGKLDPTRVMGVAGRFRAGSGTPFDLAELRFEPAVRAGDVDLGRITHVRVVDIIGDGLTTDSFGNPIYDPTPTWGTAGFDLEAVGVLE